MPSLDSGHDAGLGVWREDQGIADAKRAGIDASRDDPALVEAINVLHRKAERQFGQRLRRFEGVEHFEDGRAGIPGDCWLDSFRAVDRSIAAAGDVDAVAGGDGDEGARFDADLPEEIFILGDDAVEDRLGIIDEVHLVHRHDDLADAEQTQEIAVPARLLANAFIRRDEQDGGIRAGRARDHVLEEFLMSRRVDDHVRPPLGLELNLRRVDGDILLLLLK